MRPNSRFAQRSPVEWVVRGLLLVLIVGVGSIVLRATMGNVLQSNPILAHAFAPFDGRITARLAQQILERNGAAPQATAAERFARLALVQDATAVRAVSTLGLVLQLRRDISGARRAFAYARSLSRRDLQTQLWAIEDAVSRNDISGALAQYDIALRTSSVAPGLLFPVLASAVSDPAIRAGMIKTLARKPSWCGNFINYLVESGPDPISTARLLIDMHRSGVMQSDSPKALLISRLIEGGFYDQAWTYYSAFRHGELRDESRDPNFLADNPDPTPFDWNIINEGGVSTSIQRGERGGIFDFSASAAVGGRVLQQVQMLPAGHYRLEGHSRAIDQSPDALPYWELTCRDGRPLGRVNLLNSNKANGWFAGQFSVPEGCALQTLALFARPADSISGVAGQIDYVRLFRIR